MSVEVGVLGSSKNVPIKNWNLILWLTVLVAEELNEPRFG